MTALQQIDGEQVLLTIGLEFTPELIEIVDDYFFRQSIQARGKVAQQGA